MHGSVPKEQPKRSAVLIPQTHRVVPVVLPGLPFFFPCRSGLENAFRYCFAAPGVLLCRSLPAFSTAWSHSSKEEVPHQCAAKLWALGQRGSGMRSWPWSPTAPLRSCSPIADCGPRPPLPYLRCHHAAAAIMIAVSYKLTALWCYGRRHEHGVIARCVSGAHLYWDT